MREYFENIISLKNKVVVDWGCNHGNMLEYQHCDFKYIGIDVDKEIIDQNKKKWPEHKWIHLNAYNHQYNQNGVDKLNVYNLPKHDLVLMFSIFTHMDIYTMKKYIEYMKAPLLTTFIPSNDKIKLERALGYRLDKELYKQVIDKPYCYVVATPNDVIIYDGIEKINKMNNVWYFLVIHHPDYMKQFGDIIETPFTGNDIRSTQICLSVK